MQRYTLRLDGFVSARANRQGGDLLTRPPAFHGTQLELNCSTSAAGSIRVEVQDEAGAPVAGFALADCLEIFGDTLARVVTWKRGADLSRLAGKPVRLRFEFKDADL